MFNPRVDRAMGRLSVDDLEATLNLSQSALIKTSGQFGHKLIDLS